MKHIHLICLLLVNTREWLANRHLEGFDKDSFVQIYSSDWKHRQTHILIYRDAPYYIWASENGQSWEFYHIILSNFLFKVPKYSVV